MNNFSKKSAIIPLLLCGMLVGCLDSKKPTKVETLADKAEAAAIEVALATIDPQEIKTIERRRKLMGQPGLVLYVVYLNDMGQPIEYFPTDGKCSSSRKRLSKPYELVKGDKGSYTGWFSIPAASEDGTHGKSDEYTYCFTADGKYKQWNGDRLISDKPIELTIKPLVVDLSGKNQQNQ